MTEQQSDRNLASETASGALSATSNRRDVLKTATGLVAAVAVGGAFLASSEDVAAGGAPTRTVVKFDAFARSFEVQSLQFGLANVVGGKVSYSDLSVTKLIDSSTVKLQLACASGNPFAKCDISFYRESVFVGFITLERVFVTSDSISHGGGDPFQIAEAVSIAFTKITFKFAGAIYTWDITTNTGA